jgi:Zn-finger nucleic acid-binding protein
MYCPVCKDERLAISEKNGIEIDYCPKCRGIWLDRGELDKIIERSSAYPPARGDSAPRYSEDRQAHPPERGRDPDTSRRREESHDRHREGHQRREEAHGGHGDYRDGYKKKKREGFLADLFDFD